MQLGVLIPVVAERGTRAMPLMRCRDAMGQAA